MGSASRVALAAAKAAVEKAGKLSSETGVALLAAGRALGSVPALRGALSNRIADASAKASLIDSVLGKIDKGALELVKKIVAEQLGVNEADIKNESSFVDDLGADSLDTVELVMALEEEFECEIPDEQAEKITTVQQAVDFILANKK